MGRDKALCGSGRSDEKDQTIGYHFDFGSSDNFVQCDKREIFNFLLGVDKQRDYIYNQLHFICDNTNINYNNGNYVYTNYYNSDYNSYASLEPEILSFPCNNNLIDYKRITESLRYKEETYKKIKF